MNHVFLNRCFCDYYVSSLAIRDVISVLKQINLFDRTKSIKLLQIQKVIILNEVSLQEQIAR